MLLLTAATACGGGGGGSSRSRTTGPNTPPDALFSGGPITGTAPLLVTLDASFSTDSEDGPGGLKVRWDFEGDGAWDTAYADQKQVAHTYAAAGQYFVQVEVRDSGGLTDIGRTSVPVTVTGGTTPGPGPGPGPGPSGPVADIGVDTNRDGAVTTADETGEGAFTTTAGACFVANIDDDNNDGRRDGLDTVVNGATDLQDMALVLLRRAQLGSSHAVTLVVEPVAARSRVRIFREVGTSGTALFAPGQTQVTIPTADLNAADVRLRVEATEARSTAWDGSLTLRLRITSSGTQVSEDTVAMRCAPTIIQDNTLTPRKLYVMRLPSGGDNNLAFYNALVANLPSSVALITASDVTYGGDRWIQDNMEIGYQAMPAASGAHVVQSYVNLERSFRPLEDYVEDVCLGANSGFSYPGGSDTSHNYGGNLEVTPAYTNGTQSYPFGRLLVGGGSQGTLTGQQNTEHMTPTQRAWLDAQGAQGPALELSSEWLGVGHIDEIFQFVPNPAGGGKPFRLCIASPDLARAGLTDLRNRGFGARTAFTGRTSGTIQPRTVSAILNDTALMSFNSAAQARIDSIRAVLAQSMGLTTADIVEVPVLYHVESFGGLDMAAAYNPGVQNLVTIDRTIFAPDPEGPDDDQGDVWRRQTLAGLSPLGLTVHFVDVFYSYHELLGEAHCGTNVERDAHSVRWWQR